MIILGTETPVWDSPVERVRRHPGHRDGQEIMEGGRGKVGDHVEDQDACREENSRAAGLHEERDVATFDRPRGFHLKFFATFFHLTYL